MGWRVSFPNWVEIMKSDRYKRASFARKILLGRLVLGFSGFIIAVSIAAGTAWSLDDQSPINQKFDQKAAYVLKISPQAGGADPGPSALSRNSSIGGGCSSHSYAVRYAPKRPMDDGRRSASAAAVLGLVFGVRYALTPPENTSLARSRGTQVCS